MRLEAEGKTWILPPSRAAWLAVHTPIGMCFSAPITCCPVLCKPESIPAPNAACSVFEMTPLAREMILACRAWGPEDAAREPLAAHMFQTLAALCQGLAAHPGNTWIPTGKTENLRRALRYTGNNRERDLTFADVASLSLRTWRGDLQKKPV